jgi:hypothetical protein
MRISKRKKKKARNLSKSIIGQHWSKLSTHALQDLEKGYFAI